MNKTNYSLINYIALLLTIIGGINWGLVGVFNFDLVKFISDIFETEKLARVVYIMVGSSAVYLLIKEIIKLLISENK